MTDYKTLSDSELTEALNFHRRQRNMSRGINEAAHMRQTQVVRLLEAEEARRLEEAVQVDKKNYSWGKMITVRHGSSHSFPLHPEHQEKIKNLKDGESTAFKDETGSHVTAHREGDKVHLKLRGANQKTTVAHSHFTEEVNQLDEIGDTAKGRKALKAVISRAPEKAANLRMKADILGRRQFDPDVSGENSEKYGKASDTAYKKYQHTVKSAARAVDRLTKEEIELDEVSASTLRSYIDKSRADKKAAMKDRTAAEKNVKKYGMASDKKERDDAARRVVNRNQGISVANKKLGTYPADKAKAKVMAREEVEINEASDLRVTKIYNKWPKKATYAVHNANRSYFKEFDSEEAARAHHKEKSSMKEEVFTEAKLERNKNTVGAHHLERDSGDHKMYTAYTGSLVRRLHTVTDKDDNILGQGTSAASAMAKAKLKKPHRDALMHDDNQIVKVHDTRGAQNVGTQVVTPGKGKWFKDHDEAMTYAKSLPGKIRHADPKTGHVD